MTYTTPDCADEPGVFTMASIHAGGTAWRVNRCPICGAELRSAVCNKNTDPEIQP